MGPNRPGRGAHVATASFMVDPAAQGRGVGRALGEHVVAWARDAGYRAIQFNAVVETNTGAVRLWQSLGFRILTTVPGAFDHREHGYVGLHVMYLELSPACAVHGRTAVGSRSRVTPNVSSTEATTRSANVSSSVAVAPGSVVRARL